MRRSVPPIELTERALFDLREIERYSVETWGRKTADKYLDEIAAALDRIRDNPDILRLEPELASGLFFYRVKRHFLVCDIVNVRITLLAVIHTSMDLPTRLLELEPRIVAETQMLRSKLQRKREQD